MLMRGMFTPAKNSTRGCQCMEMHPYGYLLIGAIWRLCMCILASVCLCVCLSVCMCVYVFAFFQRS